MSQIDMKFEKEIVKKISLNYLLYLPENYDQNKNYPLIVFLHGAGERGDNLELVKKHGIPKIVETEQNFQFIVVSPQCPKNSWWAMFSEELFELLKNIEDDYSIDKNRIYLTGLSMGGFGTWDMAVKYPNKFAAIAPICGGLEDTDEVRKLVHIPIWVFHGAKDAVVPIKASEELVDVLKECGGNVQFTIYPELEHDSWTETYNNPKLCEWFLKQERKK